MGDSNLRVARNVVCGHGGVVVGETRATGRNRPSSILLSRTHSRSGDDLRGQRGSVIRDCRVCLFSFFLYDPVYSFYVSNTRALGELFWFLIMALIGVKCVTELRHPSKN